MKVKIVKGKYDIQRDHVKAAILMADMELMVDHIKSLNTQGGQVKVFLEPGDNWYDTAIKLNKNLYGLKQAYHDYSFQRHVFQEKIPDISFDVRGGSWSPLDAKTIPIVFDVL